VRAAAFQNQPPMWLSTASVISRSWPIRWSSTWRGTFPLRKPGTLIALGEVVGRVLDGVVHVVRRHLDRQSDTVLR